MRHSTAKLSEMFDNYNHVHFHGELPKVPIEINERLTASAGRARWRYTARSVSMITDTGKLELKAVKHCTPTVIEVSGPIFDRYGWDYKEAGWVHTELEKTVLHEMCHCYLAFWYGDEGHSQHFHNLMGKITGVRGNHRCHHLLTFGLTATPKPKVIKPGRVAGGISLKGKP